jgi:hypothetical protein
MAVKKKKLLESVLTKANSMELDAKQEIALNSILSIVDKAIVKKVNSDEKALADLVNYCDNLMNYVANIRYQDWPTIGLGIDLNPEEMDELLYRGESILRKAKKSLPKKVKNEKSTSK